MARDTEFVVFFFAPLYVSAAIMLTLYNVLQNPTGSRSPRWRFWRREEEMASDEEAGLLGTPRNIIGYGTFAPGPTNRRLEISPQSKAREIGSFFPHRRVDPSPSSFDWAYEPIRLLQHNNEGPVFLVRSRQTQELCIIKQLNPRISPNKRPGKPIEAENLSTHLSNRRHRNILQLREVLIDDTQRMRPIASMVVEFCSGGDLLNFMEAQPEDSLVPEYFILHFTASMIDALAFLHDGHISFDPTTGRVTECIPASEQTPMLHRDQKPQNIFLRFNHANKYGMPDVVLGDFGLAVPEYSALNSGACGTEGYMAPEVEEHLRLQEQDPAWADKPVCTTGSDMYSFALTLFALMTSRRYRPGRDDLSVIFRHSSVAQHPEILDILQRCLRHEEINRPEACHLHEYSAIFKARLQAWYESGGRLPEGIWPDPLLWDDFVAAGGRSSDSSDSEQVTPGSSSEFESQPRTSSDLIDFVTPPRGGQLPGTPSAPRPNPRC